MKPRLAGLFLALTSIAAAQDAKLSFFGKWKYETSRFAGDREVPNVQHNEPDFAITARVEVPMLHTFTYRTNGTQPGPVRRMIGSERAAHWKGKALVDEAH